MRIQIESMSKHPHQVDWSLGKTSLAQGEQKWHNKQNAKGYLSKSGQSYDFQLANTT